MTYNPERGPGLRRNELGPVGDRIFVLRQAELMARKFDYLLEEGSQQTPSKPKKSQPAQSQPATHSRADEARYQIASIQQAMEQGQS